jgi:hypothetical protein
MLSAPVVPMLPQCVNVNDGEAAVLFGANFNPAHDASVMNEFVAVEKGLPAAPPPFPIVPPPD